MRASASHPPTKPLPRINGPERHFWEGLREREIRVLRAAIALGATVISLRGRRSILRVKWRASASSTRPISRVLQANCPTP